MRVLAWVCAVMLAVVAADAKCEGAGGIEEMRRCFESPPDDARVMMRWWWFGPAVTGEEITRELRAVKEAGIGGVEIQSVYPLALDDPKAGIKNLSYLSDGFIEALRHANGEARALGLRVDLTLGSGWPFGGPSVPIEQAAGRLRVERVKVEDGSAVLPAEKHGAAEVLFFISSHTRQQVKRASVGAEGFVLNHYDRAATDAYLKNVGERLLQGFDKAPPYSIFCDSLEVYLSDWTEDLLAEFARRRGYDLKPYLPALVGEFGPRTADVRQDWGRTLTELLNERFVEPMRAWAAKHHTRFRMQAYGTPPATLSTNRLVDLPEGEGFQWRGLSATRWASSASHLYGRPVTSSETWTWVHSPAFAATPLDLKAEADLHFLQGINQLIGHGWPYSPPGVEYPGWRFYAAGALNDKNPWWIVMPDLTRYLQRTSYLLRQGEPVNDIALYLPNCDAWASMQNKQVEMIKLLRARIGDAIVPAILDAGYNFDFVDDEALREDLLRQRKYKAVILPNVERMPVETLRKLEAFARGGGAVVATRRMLQDERASAHFVADEQADLGKRLNALVAPDVVFDGEKADVGFVHRHTDEGEIYFVANTAPVARKVKATFRVSGDHAEWWDPFSGDSVTMSDGATVLLELEPYESRFVVFSRGEKVAAQPTTQAAVQPRAIDLSPGWRVSFGDGHVVEMKKLCSWTEDEATRHYSGTATYVKSFELPSGYLRPGMRVVLDLGPAKALPVQMLRNGMRAWIDAPVRDAAVVFVNGERIGAIWRPPYSLDVRRALRAGSNELKIIVGNTAINALSGQTQPDYKELNQRYGERFKAQDMENLEPLPSGLLGPIQLIDQP